MGNHYSIDHTAEDHVHTSITYNIDETQQKYGIGMVSYRFLGSLNMFYRIRNLGLSFCSGSKHFVRMKVF